MLSVHASERLLQRVGKLATLAEVEAAVRKVGKFQVGETGVVFKRLPRVVTVTTPDGAVSKGDTLVLVYVRNSAADTGCVATIQLRGSWQGKSPRWAAMVKLV